MCELLGFSGRRPVSLAEPLREFFSHSRQNPHGWGIMYENFGLRLRREAVKASESPALRQLMSELPPQRELLAHIRYATVGAVRAENCHPFQGADLSGRVWTMIHNGTVYSGRDTYRWYRLQAGDTDSERLFLALLDRINERLRRGSMNERERFSLVDGFITENSPRNKLNLMIFDGELLYVHKNLKNSLSFRSFEDGLLFSTVPLDSSGWQPFPLAEVIAYRQGREVYRGERHKGIFVPTLEYITALDAMNI